MARMQEIRVLCVDDNELVCDALQVALRRAGGFTWLGACYNADGLSEKVRRDGAEVVVLDLDMPGREAMGAIAELARDYPSARVIVYTGHARPDLVDASLDAGAWGFVSKSERADAIIDAIRMVHAGRLAVFAGRPGLVTPPAGGGELCPIPGRDAVGSPGRARQTPSTTGEKRPGEARPLVRPGGER